MQDSNFSILIEMKYQLIYSKDTNYYWTVTKNIVKRVQNEIKNYLPVYTDFSSVFIRFDNFLIFKNKNVLKI